MNEKEIIRSKIPSVVYDAHRFLTDQNVLSPDPLDYISETYKFIRDYIGFEESIISEENKQK